MKLEVYKCDECGEPRKETNHWWVQTIRNIDPGPCIGLHTWAKGIEMQFDERTEVKHLCSESCVTKALSKWMSQRSNGK